MLRKIKGITRLGSPIAELLLNPCSNKESDRKSENLFNYILIGHNLFFLTVSLFDPVNVLKKVN
ncbi:hypothetical protein LPB144_09010 [Christiangramia salexigens]|uniref:Uncharacterized protein n=1 Tax=Christiangramia salexigens TaxID=1913577 RepID=A0A1L3J5Z4_9FLAO|nr:hypothetical protein LPB144_09010 [Christiangramia salexigens]